MVVGTVAGDPAQALIIRSSASSRQTVRSGWIQDTRILLSSSFLM
jgi:hypothetical protein